ncbi:hypothetical protein RFI_28117 [Reticulomyxa filosa]|uniref:Uncharacterized protein n=1 Tax=Reticulomyxa filosa TaxID=46433 RepID=X6M8B7_RETFI|nr:hypothetical protein RFI_28117 [Reticulomyxa filosa]|eukprot:ETO09270.1 hypothetical protein RFI_28117 [Reticulomyxa filosa]
MRVCVCVCDVVSLCSVLEQMNGNDDQLEIKKQMIEELDEKVRVGFDLHMMTMKKKSGKNKLENSIDQAISMVCHLFWKRRGGGEEKENKRLYKKKKKIYICICICIYIIYLYITERQWRKYEQSGKERRQWNDDDRDNNERERRAGDASDKLSRTMLRFLEDNNILEDLSLMGTIHGEERTVDLSERNWKETSHISRVEYGFEIFQHFAAWSNKTFSKSSSRPWLWKAMHCSIHSKCYANWLRPRSRLCTRDSSSNGI